MASSTTLINTAILIFLAMAMVAPEAQAINCRQVVQTVLPCLGYLKNGGAVSTVCCGGVRSLNSAMRATPDRQQACVCLREAAQAYGINYGFANSLPGKCGVDIGITISKSMDCSRYGFIQTRSAYLGGNFNGKPYKNHFKSCQKVQKRYHQ